MAAVWLSRECQMYPLDRPSYLDSLCKADAPFAELYARVHPRTRRRLARSVERAARRAAVSVLQRLDDLASSQGMEIEEYVRALEEWQALERDG